MLATSPYLNFKPRSYEEATMDRERERELREQERQGPSEEQRRYNDKLVVLFLRQAVEHLRVANVRIEMANARRPIGSTYIDQKNGIADLIGELQAAIKELE